MSPYLPLSIWIHSYARGVSRARQSRREMEHEPGLQWLAGMEVVNHHTLSDFRVAHGSALQNLMEQVLGVLFSQIFLQDMKYCFRLFSHSVGSRRRRHLSSRWNWDE